MNHRPFNLNSTSVAASMEGFGSSTGAIRNKKNEWLSSQKSGIFAKVVATVAAIGLVSLAVVFAVPIIKKSLSHNVPVSHALNHHNQAHNGTFDQSGLEEMLKSYGYNSGLEKDALQLCELKPESRNELGKGTWSLLHIMASTYPPNPSPEVIQDHKLFFQLLPRIYPCPDCRNHMRQMFLELPPQLNSRTAFMHWLCEAHNRVNVRLNKPTFDCDKLDERWDCGCNIVPGQALGGENNAPVQNINSHPSSKKDQDSRKEHRSRGSKADKKDRESRRDRDHQSRKSDKNHINKLMTIKPEKDEKKN